ncbi:hypothetical protein Enr13x_53640 [Stieleria neptunia]|uniref:YdhG-like domain-containing protein n=1 Tax=Stieleria neptunia TaxID=2527979 RepID=A0A518HX97_9BACT|nr:YdeI/OmpD-associated family protein [Stieleria neptunia]QDV45485.1 hypothetical protein Enr13x_53640 [Stieleria neptunia]
MKRFKTVDEFIAGSESWQDELKRLREILRSTELDETVKWGAPCYTYEGKNLVGIGAFQSYFGLWFFQGGLLSDPEGVLINAQDGKTKAMRQWRLTSMKEIKPRTIKAYVKEATQLQIEGHEIKPVRGKPVTIPPELKAALARNKTARTAFDQLTPGKQREYADYIADAKRDTTKASRLEKILPMIAQGKGLNDKYR